MPFASPRSLLGIPGCGLDAVDKLWKSACALLPPDPYWLARCEGWQVTTPNGRLGSVRRLLYGTRLDRPDALIIQTGLFKFLFGALRLLTRAACADLPLSDENMTTPLGPRKITLTPRSGRVLRRRWTDSTSSSGPSSSTLAEYIDCASLRARVPGGGTRSRTSGSQMPNTHRAEKADHSARSRHPYIRHEKESCSAGLGETGPPRSSCGTPAVWSPPEPECREGGLR